MKKDFITVSPDNGGTTQVSVVADPNSTFQFRSTTLNFSAGGGVSRAITVNQRWHTAYACRGAYFTC